MTNELLAHCIKERANGRRVGLGFVKEAVRELNGRYPTDAEALQVLVKANAKQPRMVRQEESGIVHWRLSTCAKQNHAD